jgi:hypothetical protein
VNPVAKHDSDFIHFQLGDVGTATLCGLVTAAPRWQYVMPDDIDPFPWCGRCTTSKPWKAAMDAERAAKQAAALETKQGAGE